MARRANSTLIGAFVLGRAIRTLDAENVDNQAKRLAANLEVVDTLNELNRAARALRTLSEETDRQPDVLIFGRGGVKE